MRLRISLATALLLVMIGGDAAAYPQFQLSTGNSRCNLCHFSPAGGGLINEYGRDESGDTISRYGEGSFLYGLYDEPDWLKLGADFRSAAVTRRRNGETKNAVFPMQGELYSYLKHGAFSLYGVLGIRAQVRSERPSIADRIGSREHYLMWRPSKKIYARVGRFFTPFGVRSQDHTLYVRRDIDMYAFEETYNLSVSVVENEWEAHVTGFVRPPDELRGAGAPGGGASAYYERRVGEGAILAGQVRSRFSDEESRHVFGGVGKYFFESPAVLVMAELNGAVQTFSADSSPARSQFISYLGASYWPTQGLMLTTSYERYEEDLAAANTYRDAYTLTVQLFPITHFEVMLIGKIELIGEYNEPNTMGMLQLHYYL